MTGYAISSTLTALLVATATVALTACGPDDTAAGNNTAQTSSIPVSQAVMPSAAPSLAASTAAPSVAPADPATAADAASDGAVTDVQASLAADSRQIAPVMHYAPGESSN